MRKVGTKALRIILAGGLFMLASVTVQAFDLGDIAIHGFISQGYVETTGNNIFSMESTEGSFEFNEVGINFTAEPVENLRIGIQLFARDLGQQGNNNVEVDWAVGDYRWRDYLGFRAGKVKMPFGLYGDVRDADMSRNSILLPQGMYSELLRDLINAYQGGELYGTIGMAGAGELEYRAFGGTVNLDDVYVVERFMTNGARSGLANLPVPLDQASFTVDNIKANMDAIYGLSLQWNAPVDGLRFRATYHSSESHFSSTTTYSGWMGDIPASITMGTETLYDTEHSCVGSVEYRWEKLLVAAEYWRSRTSVTNTITLLPFPLPPMPTMTDDVEAYYAQAAYQFTDWFQLGTYYSIYYPDRDDKDGDNLVARGRPAHQAWSKDLALTARFDITSNLLFKIEMHSFDGSALADSAENPDGTVRDWESYLARFTFYF